MSKTAPYFILTAFANQIHAGNPAAVVFLDPSLPTNTLGTIARNFNQPMTSFVSPSPLPSKNPKSVAFAIRWFTPAAIEVPICGHGTLAAAKAVFGRSDLVGEEVEVIEFHTLTHGIMTARKVEDDFIAIQLPSANQAEVTGEEKVKISQMVRSAFGKEDLAINYIGKGVDGWDHCLLVELDEKENLKGCRVAAQELRAAGFSTNIITTVSSTGEELFVSRMFAPGYVPGDEDFVCGSAHCVMTPYWSKKKGVPRGQEIKATQVSARGGKLKLVWESDKDAVTLMGQLAVLAKGEMYLP